MRSRHLIVGNWKMNLGPKAATELAVALGTVCKSLARTDVWVTPSALSIPAVVQVLKSTPIAVGTQNVHWLAAGAQTGETSPEFAKEVGCSFTLVGHSERRHLFGESCTLVAERAKGALQAGLTIIVCTGETMPEREAGKTESVIAEQLTTVFEKIAPEQSEKVIVAYEPVWAIGTGKVAEISDIESAHGFIQKLWQDRFKGTAQILYGGSVNPTNFAAILASGLVDGALVGGASLKLDQLTELIKIAEATPASLPKRA